MGDIELSPDTIEVIERYVRDDKPPSFRGLERTCTAALKQMAEKVFLEKCVKRMVQLKNTAPRFNEWDTKFDTYFKDSLLVTFIPFGHGRLKWGYRYLILCKCEDFFYEHGQEIAEAYIKSRWGTTTNAVENTSSFLELCTDYAEWFEERREKFMVDMKAAIAELKKFQMSEKPQSHGGVAKLLKTLTATMEKRGADITSIAKVQYAVCVQAGIYIPDEFLSDVAVAMDILENEEGERE